MPQTLIEKIAQAFAYMPGKEHTVRSGDYISIKPAYVMTHDNTGAVIPKFKSIGAASLAIPSQVVHTLDHNVQDKSEKNLEKYKKIEEFSRSMGADFYPAGRGIGHQIMCEEGYAFPGTMVVASDSHSNMYGGLGCLGTPVVRTDAAAIWTTGRTWWQVPPIVQVKLNGKLSEGVTGKDVIIALCGFFNHDEVLNCALEFTGEGIKYLTIDERLSIANMTTEWGALAGVFPIDEVTFKWLEDRAVYLSMRGPAGVSSDKSHSGNDNPRLNRNRIQKLKENTPMADEDAYYAKTITIDLGSIVPYVSGPNTVKTYHPVTYFEQNEVKIQKAYLVSCVNSRLEDLAAASRVVKGRRVADGVKFYVAAASSEVQQMSIQLGYWQDLLDAGATPLPPGCGPCIGLGEGLLEDGESGISATNRNFKGRMGSPNAFAYLASPAVVAHSAITGKIASPGKFSDVSITASFDESKPSEAVSAEVEILDGFPSEINGEIIYCHQDNLNTDGIYPGKYTYNDDMTPAQQAEVVMENYDPEFISIVAKGDILAGGYNFGTGSSREQAATALKYKGIQLVIAGSFNETYKRNALNNGFLCIEAQELVNDLKNKFGSNALTVKTGTNITVDFRHSVIRTPDRQYTIAPVGLAAQELIVYGGLENWVKKQIGK